MISFKNIKKTITKNCCFQSVKGNGKCFTNKANNKTNHTQFFKKLTTNCTILVKNTLVLAKHFKGLGSHSPTQGKNSFISTINNHILGKNSPVLGKNMGVFAVIKHIICSLSILFINQQLGNSPKMRVAVAAQNNFYG